MMQDFRPLSSGSLKDLEIQLSVLYWKHPPRSRNPNGYRCKQSMGPSVYIFPSQLTYHAREKETCQPSLQGQRAAAARRMDMGLHSNQTHTHKSARSLRDPTHQTNHRNCQAVPKSQAGPPRLDRCGRQLGPGDTIKRERKERGGREGFLASMAD
ncbi:uncharacterized protein BO95DRAFT_113393 [Aspergillus brunneoviolaceus CBS 621.78]|uniref:Uncharacterized protein n=1 Tax=Aspergillus brunneoviolaceus CBS 621.78 TaxID=1450534 RepID=A0ACD1GND3_9EURO|nr:hypothetical protein BO95DRAFT_113393 [Aspergillus brunneoviolaceus CBS 621.78]RAH50784.1 hypothetical protein BO95DRAFT_113393 [Aspergillus brunneoviolaceus CBS 621.78]